MTMNNFSAAPESTIQTIKDYVNHGLEPGSFVRAVLENNLAMAFAKADIYNERALKQIVTYVFNKIPHNSWGSPEAVENWLKRFGEK